MKTVCLFILAITWFIGGAARAVEFGTIEHGGKRYTVCRVDPVRETLGLFHRDEDGKPFNRFDPLAQKVQGRGQRLVFAMNAGMYHGDFSAVGLYVENGRELYPLNTGNAEGNFFLKPNGVFALTGKGARVVESSEYPRLKGEGVRFATQSGPLLLRRGRVHPAFRPGSTSRLLRNGVGVSASGKAVFVISEDQVNFHEFATVFRDRLGCADALFFDGTVSSLYAPALKRNDFRMDLGPIIGVTEP